MTLQEIITAYDGVIELYGSAYSTEKYQMEVILVLAKEIQALKDYVREYEEDL